MDYYQLLNLPRNATGEQIQKSYHELALKYHPDVNPGDASAAEKFKEINKAYQALRHAEKRKEYDATLGGGTRLSPPKGPTRATNSPNSPPPRTAPPSTGNPLMDVLGGMHNTARANAGGEASETTETKSSTTPTIAIKLTMREVLAGTTKTVLINGRPLRIQISVER